MKQDDSGVHISFDHGSSVVLTYDPFRLDFMVENQVAVSVNSKGLMNFEHYREKMWVLEMERDMGVFGLPDLAISWFGF